MIVTDVGERTPEDLKTTSESVLAAIPDKESTAELKKRLQKDLPRLVEDVARELPQTGGIVAFSFENEGIESYTFTETSRTLLDCSKPLTILSHRGKRAMLYSAGRAATNPDVYATATKWLKIAFGYVEDFAIPTLEPKEQQEFEKVMKNVLIKKGKCELRVEMLTEYRTLDPIERRLIFTRM